MLPEVESSSVLEAEDIDHDNAGHSTTDDGEDLSVFGRTPDPQVCRSVFVVREPLLTDPSLSPTCLARGSRTDHLHVPPKDVNLVVGDMYPWELKFKLIVKRLRWYGVICACIPRASTYACSLQPASISLLVRPLGARSLNLPTFQRRSGRWNFPYGQSGSRGCVYHFIQPSF